MANKQPADKSAQTTLQRGKACLRCRKRKMKCDGVKPACQQCVRAKKPDACEYDDGKGKTRTQLMRETILRLERRVRELEDPEYVSPAVTLYDPHGHSRSGSSASSVDSPDGSFLSVPHSPFPSGSPSSPAAAWTRVCLSSNSDLHLPSLIVCQNVPSPSPTPFLSEMFFEEPRSYLHMSPDLGSILLDIFAPHQQQCGLGIDIHQLRESLHRNPSERSHPVLLNAIYLWACFVSRPEPLCQNEDHYLRLVLETLPDALKSTDKIVDAIQASCLLSMYYLANGRMCEGGYHASAAAALAVQAGLGRNAFQNDLWPPACSFEDFDLKPAKTAPQDDARIMSFWQIFSLDRCWSVFLQRPSIIPDGPDARNVISCPWPQDLGSYETGLISGCSPLPTVRAFLNGDVSSGGFSAIVLRAKASALFAQADAVANLAGMKQNGRFADEVTALDHTISLFLSMLLPINQLNQVMPEERQSLILAHTLANCAVLHLHRASAHGDSVSFEKCSHAVRACVNVMRQITEQDYPFLDPVLAPCWSSISDHLVVELDTMESAWPSMNVSEIRDELSTILQAMTIFATRYPVITPDLNRLRKRLMS
ncbi:hypothetical protein AGABI2DRAFT_192596 [Agaricus bisporus var. bisporus H97]|uniref:hypothetical protein n=1 Tax=Agaricus bisporus var. bisporus (strain H97 / ATCC MYA-4626 / FGSC 10389) TaxID=936046 RepID=UPI00029F66BA|nr:hypothetical protein AGABI2DRAFT_192596 [Agaricus bisporus var. bisporus H97]EKV47410.1 hypothetical protein AGABI2DRAFT_192596 [Agaricus bisporus var. bisporus H97]